MGGAIPPLSLMPLSLHLGYEAGMLGAQTIILIVKFREPTELVSERDGSHEFFWYLFSCDCGPGISVGIATELRPGRSGN